MPTTLFFFLKFLRRAINAIKLTLISIRYTVIYLIASAFKRNFKQNFVFSKLFFWEYISRLKRNLKNSSLPWHQKGPLFLNELAKLFSIYISNYATLINPDINRKNVVTYHPIALDKIKETTTSLHSILPNSNNCSYSLLLIIESNSFNNFKKLLNSAINNSAPHFDIVVGFLQKTTEEIDSFFKTTKIALGHKIQRVDNTFNLATLCNKMVKISQGTQIVFLKEGVMRPDLLFRFEQILLQRLDRDELILYPEENEINKFGQHVIKNLFFSEDKLAFPYLFYTELPNCFTISKAAWNKINGCQETINKSAIYDLFLRADLANLKFQKLTIPLFATFPVKNTPPIDEFILVFKNYITTKELPWEISEGLLKTSIRAVPALKTTPKIHVIIPFKDQKEMTLDVVKSLKNQSGIDLKITMIDNRSKDLSIRELLSKEGAEVIVIDEPFNFSRLNNLALQRSQVGEDYPLVLFLNNDIELFEGALLELSRWIDQPNIGMVGGRLLFPNGRLQCGSTKIKSNSSAQELNWIIPERLKPDMELTLQKTLHITEAVSGAMLLMKKSLFRELGGFDEILYPNTYSDTALCAKALKRGYFPFYTPYAVATHYESLSRVTDNIEDFENSRWVYESFV